MNPSRVVPTLTEVLDEAVCRPLPVTERPFVAMPEVEPLALPVLDFELDLGEPVAEAVAPPPGLLQAAEGDLRQRLSLSFESAVDELLQEATARLTASVLAELRQQLAPRLDLLLQQSLDEALRQERERLPG